VTLDQESLSQEIADAEVLAISPGRSYLAVALNSKGEVSWSTNFPHFVEGSGVSLLVVSADGRERTTVLSNVPLFNAAYTPDGRLVVTVLRNSMVTYTIYQTNGKSPHELHYSENVLATPESNVPVEVTEEP